MAVYHLILGEKERDIEAEDLVTAKRQAVKLGLREVCDVSLQTLKGHLWTKHLVITPVGPDYSQWQRMDTALSLEMY